MEQTGRQVPTREPLPVSGLRGISAPPVWCVTPLSTLVEREEGEQQDRGGRQEQIEWVNKTVEGEEDLCERQQPSLL